MCGLRGTVARPFISAVFIFAGKKAVVAVLALFNINNQRILFHSSASSS
jgi:hypothetical protein